ncbi:MAG: calcium/sodium antiporter [Thermoplasmata archaeon]|nr:MAG: calcium/sodium antiporter [Thermoplasmata archaeon]
MDATIGVFDAGLFGLFGSSLYFLAIYTILRLFYHSKTGDKSLYWGTSFSILNIEMEDTVSMELWLSILIFIIGLAILIRGSDFFVGSAAFMARHFGVSELIIGLTLVSMGTSLPELGASVYASATNKGGIAVGNVVGSNIANIALVLGICLLLQRIKVRKKMLKRDGIFMLGVSLLFTLFIFGGVVRWEGLVLIVIFAVYLFYLYKENKDERESEALRKVIEESIERDRRIGGEIAKLIIEKKDEDEKKAELEVTKEEKQKNPGLAKEISKLIIGCLGVIVGAWLMVEMAVNISESMGISQTVIGSTLVAFGTSVPELAVSVVAILKRYEQISIGNIIGSNIFNILLVIGAAALVNDLIVDNMLIFTNIPIMLLVAALLLIFMAARPRLLRWQGGVFVAIYVLFIIMNYW